MMEINFFGNRFRNVVSVEHVAYPEAMKDIAR